MVRLSGLPGLHPHIAGIVLVVLGLLVINTSDAVAKWAVEELPVFQVILFQSFGLMVMAPVVARQANPLRLIRTADPWWQLVRSGFLFISAVAFYSGLRSLQFAELIAILFLAPLAITAMAHVFLGERAGPHRWAACVVGLLGGLVIVRPGTGAMGWDALWPVLAVLSWSAYIVITRKISPRNSTGNMMLWAGLVSFTIMALSGSWYWEMPEGWQWPALAAIACLSSVANACMIRAYSLAPASLLAPFTYLEIVGATIFGWLFWREFPDAWTWLGAAIIVLAGIYVLRREALATRKATGIP